MILSFGIKHKLNAEETGGEGQPAGGSANARTDTGVPDTKGPNDDWQSNTALDENGNPKAPVADVKKDEAAPEDDKTSDDKGTGLSSEPTVDFNAPVVKQVENLLLDAGLNIKEVAEAVSENGGKLTPAILKALVTKHGESVAALIADQCTSFHTASVKKAGDQDNAIYSRIEKAFEGVTTQKGADTWTELSGWAKANIPDNERAEINKLLAQGGMAANYAVDDLVNRFKSSNGFTQPADLLSGDSTSKETGGSPISRHEYTTAMRELERKGHIYGQSTEMARLDRRRTLGQKAGI